MLKKGVKPFDTDMNKDFWDTFANKDSLEFSSDDLNKSAKRGCSYCTLILEHLNQHSIAFTTAYWSLAEYVPGSDRPFLQLEGPSARVELCAPTANFESKNYQLYPTVARGDRLVGSTGDEKVLSQVASWLRECRDKHRGCDAEDDDFVPTRLLYLGDAGDSPAIRLLEDVPSTARYAALSHRWSKETLEARTERRNKEERKENIPLEIFLQMMRDVISVLLKLDIYYVWIDCMCIVQDDRHDWLHEAPRMAEIYRNAELTVSATWLESSAQSLFSNRGGTEFSSLDITQPLEINGVVHLRNTIPHFGAFGNAHNSEEPHNTWNSNNEWPLLYRGWVYQEQILSRRILHFTRSELRWDCNETAACECGRFVFDDRQDGFQSERGKKEMVESRSWQDIVSEYTSGQLTKVEDKLPALAGICTAYGKEMQDDYLCGLWKSDLESTFFWKVESTVALRPAIRMPSWSWASVSGPVGFEGGSFCDIDFIDSQVVYHGEPYLGDHSGASITLKGNVVHGTLKYGTAWQEMIKASPMPSEAKSVLLNPDPPFDTLGTVYGVQAADEYFTFWPDYALSQQGKDHVPVGIDLHCLVLSQSTRSEVETGGHVSRERTSASGLVLRCVDSNLDCYERIGYFRDLDWDSSLRLAEMRTLTLV